MVNTIVKTQNGELQGMNEEEVLVWRGIPYAQPPVDELRFQPPQPPLNWEGIRDASEFGPVCPQIVDPTYMREEDYENQSEDCLYLNVWAKDTEATNRPVMVWIHGGAFVTGAGSNPLYHGANLAANGDVVVVTINYRLGPFGFLNLSTIDSRYSANLGLLDQIAALKWVQNNITAFGGDPNHITIFGESAGSMSVAALLTMDGAKGLFQQAIMESGASQILPPEGAKKHAVAYLEELNISPENLEAIKDVSTADLLNAVVQINNKRDSNGGMYFQPTIDGETLLRAPIEAIREGAAKDIRLIIGTNKDEGAFFFESLEKPLPPKVIEQTLVAFSGSEKAARLKPFYPDSVEGQSEIMTDLFFWRASLQYAAAQANHAPVWMYRFDWNTPGHPFLGKSVHALEIPFVFNNYGFFKPFKVPVSEEIKEVGTTIQASWLAFAKTGNPSTEKLSWQQYDTEKRATVIFNNESEIIYDPDQKKRRAILEEESEATNI